MTKKEHLLTCLTEECTEIIEHILFDNKEELYKELTDFIGIIELLEENDILKENVSEIFVNTFNTEKGLTKSLLDIQYYVSKSLRFGIDDIHPELKVSNYDNLIINIKEILSYTEFNVSLNESLDIWNRDGINKKKEKVLKFLEYSTSKGLIV